MFKSLGALVGVERPQRERTPVRRQSRERGREGVFWRPVTRQDVQRILMAAKRYELANRQFGARSGPLGGIAIEILELLANLVSFKTGQLDPSIDFLMDRLKRSRDAIVRALANLRTHGFLDWLRRYVPTGITGKGPQVRQTSNAYRLCLPPAAGRLLGRFFSPPPIPEDAAHAMAAHQAEVAAFAAGLTGAQLALFHHGDTPLGRSLANLGELRKQRESARRSEPQSISTDSAKK